MSKVFWLVTVLALVGCNSKIEAKKEVAVATPEPVKPIETKAEQPKAETPKIRNLHVKESHVISVLNATIVQRQQFNFTYTDKTGTGRYYLDAKTQIRTVFSGDNDDIQWAMTTIFLEKLLKEDEPQNVKSFLNAANRMVLGVSPSIVEEADGWLDAHLVESFLKKEPTTTVITGFRLDIMNIHTKDTSIVAYKISSAD